jgi:CubicO group peptidase (beta-lactamase class C family)
MTPLSLRGATALAMAIFGVHRAFAQCAYPTPVTPTTCDAAKTYNAQTGGVSLLVWVDGQPVCQDYRPAGSSAVPREAWSGTKSFWSIAAAAAIEDGIITSWDEIVADTITEWRSDARKSRITVRHLLGLTSGLKPDSSTGAVPTYSEAIQEPALYDPGTVWAYGDVQYQAFGEFLRRKVAPTYADPLAYLDARVLDRINAQYAGWTYDAGWPRLPHGSQWIAREWIKYGEFVRRGGIWLATGERIVAQELIDSSFHPTIKADYGLTWWLPLPGELGKPCDTVMAVGLGTQMVYVIRSLKLVAVRQTANPWDGLNYSDDVFLDRLLAPPAPQDDCPPAEVARLRVDRAGTDLAFDWDPANVDATGNTELLAGYLVERATRADFTDGTPLLSTTGPVSAAPASSEGGAEPGIVFYRVRARDKCGNEGP